MYRHFFKGLIGLGMTEAQWFSLGLMALGPLAVDQAASTSDLLKKRVN